MSVISNLAIGCNNTALFINGDNGAIELDGLTCFSCFKLLISSLNDIF